VCCFPLKFLDFNRNEQTQRRVYELRIILLSATHQLSHKNAKRYLPCGPGKALSPCLVVLEYIQMLCLLEDSILMEEFNNLVDLTVKCSLDMTKVSN
jgi:hypothetical protein